MLHCYKHGKQKGAESFNETRDGFHECKKCNYISYPIVKIESEFSDYQRFEGPLDDDE